MKKSVVLIGLILLAGLVNANEMINLKRTGYNEIAYAGETVPIFLNIKNVDDHDLEDVQVRIDLIELGEFGLSDAYDIDDDESASFIVLLYIPEIAQSDIYTMRISISDDDDVSRTYYRHLFIR